MPIPTPKTGEDQITYATRAHLALYAEMPDTKERNKVIFKSWKDYVGETEEEKVATQRFSSAEYERLYDIPVFKEHSYKRVLRNRDGSPVLDEETGEPKQLEERYDLKALQAIVRNCNERVVKTESFAPITAIHTGKKKADGTTEDPEVLGFGGPFKLGMYGMEDRDDGAPYKGKWAIYEDEFWFKDRVHKAREKARRSPEVYVGRPIHQRFLDPITALGAETPALDMGIHYHKTSKGELIERYSSPDIVAYDGMATMPGPTNVSVPKPVSVGKKKVAKYEEQEEATPHVNGDKAEYDDEELSQLASKTKGFHASEIVRHTKLAEDFHTKNNSRMANRHERFAEWHRREMQPYVRDMGEGKLELPAKPEVKDMGEAPLEAGKVTIKHRTPMKYSEDDIHACILESISSQLEQYGQADPEIVNACVQAMMETQPMQFVIKQMQSAAAPVVGSMEQQVAEGKKAIGQEEGDEEDGDEEDEDQEALLGNQEGEEGEEEPEEEGEEAEGVPPNSEESEEPPEEEEEMAESKVPAVAGKEKEEKENYQLLRDELRESKALYSRLSSTIASQGETINQLQAQLSASLKEKTLTTRRAKLEKLRFMGFPVDVEKEIQRCSLEMNDTTFETHLDTIVEYGQSGRIPIGTRLETPGLEVPAYIGSHTSEEVAQYGGADLATTEEIVQYQLRKQQDGEYLDWNEAKEKVLAKKGKKEKKAAKVA